jgi:undecaprenyl-diphosphatase
MLASWGLGVQATGSGSSLYDGVVEFAVGSPGWLQGLGSLYTQAGLLIFGALFVCVWWRARMKGSAAEMASALLAPLVTLAAYLVSEVSKTFIHEERPCRGLAETATVLKCPAVGDWSFPSNHSTIAAAAAMALIFAWRKLTPWVVTMAVAMAFSRVFVGAHYPHDVLAGLAVGAGVAWLLVRLSTARATQLVARLGDHPRLGFVVGIKPAETPEPLLPEPGDEELTQVLPRQPSQRYRGPDQPTVRMPAQAPRPRQRQAGPAAPRRQPPVQPRPHQ